MTLSYKKEIENKKVLFTTKISIINSKETNHVLIYNWFKGSRERGIR